MWVLAVILGILLGISLCIVLLLTIPVDLVFCIERDADFKSRVSVRWLFGLVGRDIRRKKKKPQPEKEKRRKNLISILTRTFSQAKRAIRDGEKKQEWNKRRKNTRSILAMLRTKGFPQKLLRFVRDSFRILRIHELKLNLRYGLGDPAETGLLFGAISPAMVYVRSFSSVDIQIQPDFEQLYLGGYFKGDVRLFPIQFVGPLARLTFSITTIRAIKALVVARRK